MEEKTYTDVCLIPELGQVWLEGSEQLGGIWLLAMALLPSVQSLHLGAALDKHLSQEGATDLITSSPTLPNGSCTGIPLPVCRSIIAVVGKEVKVQLPEDMQGDAAIGG